jgi:hypothetical protein
LVGREHFVRPLRGSFIGILNLCKHSECSVFWTSASRSIPPKPAVCANLPQRSAGILSRGGWRSALPAGKMTELLPRLEPGHQPAWSRATTRPGLSRLRAANNGRSASPPSRTRSSRQRWWRSSIYEAH